MIATVPAADVSHCGPEGTIQAENASAPAEPSTDLAIDDSLFDWRLDADELAPARDLPAPDAIGAALLNVIVEELAWFGSLPHGQAMSPSNWLMRRFRERGVPYRPRDWFSNVTERDRQRFSRACLRLERDGYLIRITEPLRERVTHVQPMLDGALWTLRANPNFDVTSIVEGLRRTDWGTWLADELRRNATDS